MATFLWEGKTAQGKVLRGEIEAPNLEAVFGVLRERRIRPIPERVREKGAGLEKEIKFPGLGDKVKPRDLSVFAAIGIVVTAFTPSSTPRDHLDQAKRPFGAPPLAPAPSITTFLPRVFTRAAQRTRAFNSS